MTPINKFHRNQLIKRIVKKVEDTFAQELEKHMDQNGGRCDMRDANEIWSYRDLAISEIETFKEVI
mgnify:CR=1 FL=1|tara:strand:- start:281 stop:478 length:198 start_codon:yes stop_codon:yes gene_type:complete